MSIALVASNKFVRQLKSDCQSSCLTGAIEAGETSDRAISNCPAQVKACKHLIKKQLIFSHLKILTSIMFVVETMIFQMSLKQN